MMARPGPACPEACRALGVSPRRFQSRRSSRHDRGHFQAAVTDATPRQRGTRNTIRIEPRTTLKSTEKEMKTDGKLPVSQGHKRVSPLRVGPAPVLSSLATGNSILFP